MLGSLAVVEHDGVFADGRPIVRADALSEPRAPVLGPASPQFRALGEIAWRLGGRLKNRHDG